MSSTIGIMALGILVKHFRSYNATDCDARAKRYLATLKDPEQSKKLGKVRKSGMIAYCKLHGLVDIVLNEVSDEKIKEIATKK